MNWTPERISLLRKCCDEGLSFSEIAAKLGGGISRSAVQGKIIRLKIVKPNAPSAPIRRPLTTTKSPKASEPGANGQSLKAIVARVAERSAPPPRPARADPLAAGVHLTLMDRKPGMCCFPVGGEGADTRYCCTAIGVDRRYCDHHQRAMKGRSSSPEQIAKAKAMREAKARDMKRRAA
jgi:GcrA cell cycle regulator